MPVYNAPTKDTQFILHDVLKISDSDVPGYSELEAEFTGAVLEEAGKVATNVLHPLNVVGDTEGCRLENGIVYTPTGFKDAFEQMKEGGWTGLDMPEEYGGQNMPYVLGTAVGEMFSAANQAFVMYQSLTHGAVSAILARGTDEQKDKYLPNMVSCEWTGTMNLTEPHCGTDLGLMRTKAEPQGDGSYKISGQKIFISAGEHDMADNIIHLVLAKIPGGPDGIKGVSLFIVPKFIVNEDGSLGERNGVSTGKIEEKMGIHGNSTCVMNYDEATGWLLGEEHKGMRAMFTMMNAARHTVGVQGNAVAERAYQQAIRFAAERVQGKAIEDPMGDRVAIIEHPDVKRLLLVQKCRIEPLRALCLLTASAMDKADRHLDDEERKQAQGFIEVMIPIVKGYTTEMGLENVSLALQIHGGMGFIEETGAAQHYRDQRITPIYEGTTGIQAMDIVGRKLLRDGGVMAATVIEMIAEDLKSFSSDERIARMVNALNEATDDLQLSIAHILNLSKENPQLPAAISEPYLRLWGVLVCGWLSAKAASVAVSKMEDGDDDMFYQNKIHTAKFYFSTEMPKIKYYAGMIRTSGELIVEMNSDRFSVG